MSRRRLSKRSEVVESIFEVKLSILVCTILERKTVFNVLIAELNKLRGGNSEVEILSECDNREMSIGAKRNLLLSKAKGDYVCFVDDDDWIDSEYISKILAALADNPDCVQMIGMMNTDGFNLKRFEHSIDHFEYFENYDVYYRYHNHLNPIKRDIAIQFKFPESNFGKDTNWATQIRDSGLLKIEASIDKVIYHYRYSSRK